MKKYTSLFAVALLSGATTLGAYKLVFDENNTFSKSENTVSVAPQSYMKTVGLGAENIDFVDAADKAVHSVVHVKNVSYRTVSNPILEYYYGYRGGQQQEQIGTGSGVIISEDGYIVTNNHVIKAAQDIEITLNNGKSYKAKLIGTDEKMDISLLKIDADEKLPYSTFADSDNVKVGEWVLAVGNPYNLNSTVTAGIVSAKARNLDTSGLQSFIQTDAVVNPGNSGGALVNTRGELIGINTMISSNTGSYVGYSFAVPSNITRKIIEDILEYGMVQRGMLGVQGAELNGTISKELGLKTSEGFYIGDVTKNSGAQKAGLKKGDVIIKIDNKAINTFADLNGYINTKRPSDQVKVTILRDEKMMVATVTLSKNDIVQTKFKGMELENLTSADRQKLQINSGVKITSIENPRLAQFKSELTGAVILKINTIPVTDMEQVNKLINSKQESEAIQLEIMTNSRQIVRIII
ncbi:trypsin-like peptidase domain-containing protein [Flavobacterium antarcticum]|uniref:trypsin-like peptidase domain-containing protein n=1 Tax=Flavobacterium antarcticum TaxID=271155 RepID=UPI0003B688D9|nr:trypsin-like peptidase domain-containing protein [Flavobacterium antarcticum]